MSTELQIEIQERTIKHLTSRLEKALRELKEFDKTNTALTNRLRDAEYDLRHQAESWNKRLIEAHRIYELQTASLKRQNEALTDMLVRGEMLRIRPLMITGSAQLTLPDYAKYDGLQKELYEEHKRNKLLNDALREIQTVLTNCD